MRKSLRYSVICSLNLYMAIHNDHEQEIVENDMNVLDCMTMFEFNLG